MKQLTNWEEEVYKELEVNLRLRRNFDKVFAAFATSFFNIVPNDYLTTGYESLLNFSEAEFESNLLYESSTKFGNAIVYGTSERIVNQLEKQYSSVLMNHSGKIFLDSIETKQEQTVHVNLYHHNLEIAVTSESKLLFYNLFEAQTGEDILFYTLFVVEQLGLDTNFVQLKSYGELLPNTKVFHIFKKYVRNVAAASKNEDFLENYTLINLLKCESSPELSEENR